MGSSMPLGPPPDPLGNHPLSRARSSGMPDTSPTMRSARTSAVSGRRGRRAGTRCCRPPHASRRCATDLHHVRSGVGGVDLPRPELGGEYGEHSRPGADVDHRFVGRHRHVLGQHPGDGARAKGGLGDLECQRAHRCVECDLVHRWLLVDFNRRAITIPILSRLLGRNQDHLDQRYMSPLRYLRPESG